jgi:16S rRNA processing protein RimM
MDSLIDKGYLLWIHFLHLSTFCTYQLFAPSNHFWQTFLLIVNSSRLIPAQRIFASMNEYFKTGKLVATYGLKGEVVYKHSLGKKTSLKGLQHIFVEEGKDRFLPYFIEGTKIKSDDEIWLKLEGIDTKEAAHKLTPKEVWLEAADFAKYAAKSAPISLLGYHLISQEGDLGEILEVIEQPHQVLCTISYKGKEALIPINEAFLEKVDNKSRKVYINLPDGLLDIYE